MQSIDLVREFHIAFGLGVHQTPVVPRPEVSLLRVQLLQEELGELTHALANKDMVKILDALMDLQYVLDGTVLECGMQHIKDEAFDEVHRSNMSKLGEDGQPIRDTSGRVQKGDAYSPPSLWEMVWR